MPLTPFQKHKIRRLSTVLDANRDGRVDRSDFVRRVEALARLRGWAEDSPEYGRSRRAAHQEWEIVRESADLDGGGRLTRREMSHAVEEYLIGEDPDAGGNFIFGPLPDLHDRASEPATA